MKRIQTATPLARRTSDQTTSQNDLPSSSSFTASTARPIAQPRALPSKRQRLLSPTASVAFPVSLSPENLPREITPETTSPAPPQSSPSSTSSVELRERLCSILEQQLWIENQRVAALVTYLTRLETRATAAGVDVHRVRREVEADLGDNLGVEGIEGAVGQVRDFVELVEADRKKFKGVVPGLNKFSNTDGGGWRGGGQHW